MGEPHQRIKKSPSSNKLDLASLKSEIDSLVRTYLARVESITCARLAIFKATATIRVATIQESLGNVKLVVDAIHSEISGIHQLLDCDERNTNPLAGILSSFGSTSARPSAGEQVDDSRFGHQQDTNYRVLDLGNHLLRSNSRSTARPPTSSPPHLIAILMIHIVITL